MLKDIFTKTYTKKEKYKLFLFAAISWAILKKYIDYSIISIITSIASSFIILEILNKLELQSKKENIEEHLSTTIDQLAMNLSNNNLVQSLILLESQTTSITKKHIKNINKQIKLNIDPVEAIKNTFKRYNSIQITTMIIILSQINDKALLQKQLVNYSKSIANTEVLKKEIKSEQAILPLFFIMYLLSGFGSVFYYFQDIVEYYKNNPNPLLIVFAIYLLGIILMLKLKRVE